MKILDIWEKMYNKAKVEYHREQVSPFIVAHHVVSAVESEDGEIFTGFCIESASGVMNLCAERVAALNMYMSTGKTRIRRLIACRENPPKNGGMPCGANGEMEILTDFENRITVKLKEVFPSWWGEKRYVE